VPSSSSCSEDDMEFENFLSFIPIIQFQLII
jgi:hypothetical protein